MSTNDYARVAVGMAWLAEHLPTLDGLNITAVSVTPHKVDIQVDTHDEARELAVELTEAGLDFEERDRAASSPFLVFAAENVLEVTPDEKPWQRMSVHVSAHEKEPDRPDICCGKCPPIVGGGYDCTCEGNPRCTGRGESR